MLLRSPHFPTGQAYFDLCPDSISHYEWLFHPGNPYHFEQWVRNLLKDIKELSHLLGHTFIRQPVWAPRYDVSVRWLEETLSRLIDIGVVETHRSRQRLYWLAKNFTRHTSDRYSDQSSDRTSDHTSDSETARPTRKPRSKKTSRLAPSPEHDLNSFLSWDSKEIDKKQAEQAPDLPCDQDPRNQEALHSAPISASHTKTDLDDVVICGNSHPIDKKGNGPLSVSRHPLDVCIAFAKFEQTINPKIIDPSRMGAARWRDGKDDYLIDAWQAGQYKPMDADQRRKAQPAPRPTSQAERDLVVGATPVVTVAVDTERERQALARWDEIEARRQLAFDVLPDTERTRLIEEKIWQFQHSPQAKQYRQMPPESLRECAIYQIQKELIGS